MMNAVRPRVLVVDDDPDLLQAACPSVCKAAGYDVTAVESGEAALSQLSLSRPQAVVTDSAHGRNGRDVAVRVDPANNPALPVIMLTAHGTIPDAVTATRRGMFGYLTKPFDPKALLTSWRRAVTVSGVAEPKEIGEGSAGGDAWRAEIITRSPQVEDLLAKARLVAGSDASVLIIGESGTGKELLAQAIHRASTRVEATVSSRSTAARSPSRCSSRSCSVTSRARSRVPFATTTGCSRRRTAARSSSTRSATCRCRCRSSCCACCRKAKCGRSARPPRSTVDVRIISATHRDLEEAIKAGRSARTSTTACTSSLSRCRPWPSGAKTSRPRPPLPRQLARALRQGAERIRPGCHGSASRLPGPGNVRAALQRRRAGCCAVHLRRSSRRLARQSAMRRRPGALVVRVGPLALRARLPGQAAQDHQRQRHPGGSAGQAQPHRVLQAAPATSSRSPALQERRRID